MLGKIEGRKRRGSQRMRWLYGITDSMGMCLSNSGRWWRTGKTDILQSMGSQRVIHDWASEQQKQICTLLKLFQKSTDKGKLSHTLYETIITLTSKPDKDTRKKKKRKLKANINNKGLLRWLSGKESACQCRRYRFNPWVRKISRRRKWKPNYYTCFENSMDGGAWQGVIHGNTKYCTWLSD